MPPLLIFRPKNIRLQEFEHSQINDKSLTCHFDENVSQYHFKRTADTMIIQVLPRTEEAPLLVHSWVFSFALHGLMVGAAVAFLSEVQPRPQPEPFTWKVALTNASIQPPLEPEQPAPDEAKSSQTATPVRNQQPPTQPATRSSEQAIATMPPQVVPAHAPEPPSATVQSSEPQRPAEADVAPLNQAVQYVARQEPVQEQQPETRESQQPIQPAQVAGLSTTPVEQTHQAAPAEAQPTISTSPGPASAEPEPPVPSVTAAFPSNRPTDPAQASVPGTSTSAAPALVKANAAAASARTGKADHRWLAETLWHRIQRLKQYPKLARNQGWEGRVVVRVLIKEDGSLMDANVVESSGFEILDLDAVDLIRQVCPLTLKQALGQTHVAIHIPIQYRLDQ
ncbi:MAG: TonB family protein [Nitrospirae bacterium]|nr:MAG: TonB family protein [Nitrospirota bacterium]